MSESDQQTSVAALKEQIASQIGEDTQKLSVLSDSASILTRMQEGVIIKLHIQGSRRFWKKLTAEDLGLAVKEETRQVILSAEASSVLETYFQLGRLSLLPSNKQLARLPEAERKMFVSQEELATVERNARYCLERHAVKSHWGWFVPVTRFEQWKKENAELEAEFNRLKERLLTNYDSIVGFVVEAYRPIASDAWRMVSVNKPLLKEKDTTDVVIREVVSHLAAWRGRETFINNYLDSIRSAIRKPHEVGDSFAYVVELSIIPLPSLLAQDLEHADRLYQDRAIREAQVLAELEKIATERRLEQQRVWTEEQQERERRYLALQAERDRIQQQAAMERAVLDAARREKETLIRGFYTDVIGQINDKLQLVCSSVLESLDHHEGTLRGPVSGQLRNIVRELEAFNFMEDLTIEEMIASIREALPTKTESEQAAKGTAKIDTTRLQTVLRRVEQQARSAVIDLGMTPSVRKAREDKPLTGGLLDVGIRKYRGGEVLAAEVPAAARRKRRAPTTS